ncbi:uncharacterized protein LOC105747811, partial [Orcinus orca]|uniref:uncharacterized protein LOC105747811 n=1 Tax=Orcinus orca TaxID=9733 RepID=UPI0021121087
NLPPAASPPSPHTGPYVTPVPYLGPFPGLHLPQAQSSLSTPWSPLRFLRAVGVTPVLVSSSPHQSSTVSAVWVPVNFYAIEFTSAVLLASNLASEILSAGSLVKVGGAASGGVLAGLPWLRLTLSSNAALAGATSTLGSLLGTLNGSYLLGCPAAALTAFPLGDNWPWVIDTPPWTPTQHMGSNHHALNYFAKSPAFTVKGAAAAHLPSQISKAAAAVAGGAVAVGAVPVVLGAMGFTGAGSTASSLAAKMMSAAAMADGGGVAAGSPAATLQSVGECPRWGLLWKVREDKSLRASSPDLSPGEPQSACAFVSPSVVTLSGSLKQVRCWGKVLWPRVCSAQADSAQSRLSELAGASLSHLGLGLLPQRERQLPALGFTTGVHAFGYLLAAALPKQRSLGVGETEKGSGWDLWA